MINKVSYFLNQKLLIIIFIFCIFIVCFSFIKVNSNRIIFSETDIYQDINIESIIYSCDKYDIAANYPTTKNKKINKEIKSIIDKYINKLENETKYYIQKDSDDKFNLLVKYETQKINNYIISFIFLVNYSHGNSIIDNEIITHTYNLKQGKKLELHDLFNQSTNYIIELCNISKETLLKNNTIEQKNLNWFIDDINNSLERSFDGYSFSNKYLILYFNSNKISSKYTDIYEIKIPWNHITELLKTNVYINGV